MKEIPKRYTNPFLSDEENEKLSLWNQELEHSNTEDALTNNCEDDRLTNSLAPSEFSDKETKVYTDKNVMECGLPESLICYKEGAFYVKDICVDEGIPHEERILFDENTEMLKPELVRDSTMEDYYMESNVSPEINGKIDTGLTELEPSNGHMIFKDNCDQVMIERKFDASAGTREVDANLTVNESISDQDLQNLTPDFKECRTNEEFIDAVVPNELKEMSKNDISSGDGLSGSDTVSKAVDHDGPDISLQPGEEQINSIGISSLQKDQPLPTLKSLLESFHHQPCQHPVEKILERPVENENAMEGNTTLNLNKPAMSSGVHNIEDRAELSTEPHDAPNLQDAGSDNVPLVNHGGEGESSFSVAGPISGLGTSSGHIGFSGSTSLRSDSSTTSTRSFAFPILQNEWNSSPVRMAKANPRRLQKHRGWRHGLLCCRF